MATRKVLIVDDEPAIRHVLRGILEPKGCETREAGNADETFEVLAAWQPDVVLLDVAMPGMSGLQLLGELKRMLPGTEILMMTSYPSVELVQHAMRSGADDFIAKPFTLPELWSTVERALGKREAQPET